MSRLDRVEIYETDQRVAGKILDLRASAVWGARTLRAQPANALNYIYSQVPRTLAPARTLTATMTWTHQVGGMTGPSCVAAMPLLHAGEASPLNGTAELTRRVRGGPVRS